MRRAQKRRKKNFIRIYLSRSLSISDHAHPISILNLLGTQTRYTNKYMCSKEDRYILRLLLVSWELFIHLNNIFVSVWLNAMCESRMHYKFNVHSREVQQRNHYRVCNIWLKIDEISGCKWEIRHIELNRTIATTTTPTTNAHVEERQFCEALLMGFLFLSTSWRRFGGNGDCGLMGKLEVFIYSGNSVLGVFSVFLIIDELLGRNQNIESH